LALKSTPQKIKMNKFSRNGLRDFRTNAPRLIQGRRSSNSRIFKFTGLATLLVMGLALFAAVFAGDTNLAGPTRPLGQAAAATPPQKIKNNLPIALPNTKMEARLFADQHSSQFNFDNLNRLRLERAVALGEVPASALQSQPGSFTPVPGSFQPATTPLPTNSSYSNENARALVYTPPEATAGVPVCGPDPGDDIFEPDNAPGPARDVTGSVSPALRETHSLRTISSFPANSPGFDGDNDWVKLRLNPAATYTFSTANLRPAGPVPLDTILELYRGTAAGPTTPINASDDAGPGSPASGLTYTTAAGDDAAGVFFYLRIYGKPNASCYGTYDLVISYTTVVTATVAATVTGTPSTCTDDYESDNSPDQAKELRVTYGPTPPFSGQPGTPDFSSANNDVQARLICPVGDLDWVYFDMVKGKPYSLFTTSLTNGLDTILILFEQDASGALNPLYSNDDFPGMGLASRIDFIVPATADTATGEFTRYWAAVKDVTGKGVDRLSYNLVLQSAGKAAGDCIDNYEPDGLQSVAKEILVNEVQTHVMCPNGEADWVKFYAKTGLTYSVRAAFPPTPGMDTNLHVFSVLFDPADPEKVVSQREIAANDDASATDLSSQVSFTVPVAGVYYAQVKNTGDVGRPGMTYQLTYAVAGSTVVPPTTAPSGPAPTRTATATATSTPTVTVAPTATTVASVLALKFADPAFQKLWYYTDLPVAQNQTQRSWEWGPKPGVVLHEPYAGSPGEGRQVQYFDKSRMEINNPKGDRASPWFVSNGLLVKELITGQVARGDSAFEQRNPARLQVAGDITPDNPAPTYAMFGELTGRAADQTGQVAKQGLSAGGTVQALAAPPENVRLAAYIGETGHNIPLVFYDFMLGNGKVYEKGYKDGRLRDWVFAMGYPLSEAYWVKARVDGVMRDVLVQVFERRVLTYTPANSPEWQVEMANTGQHYYLWRYSRNLPAE
jgi:hypothetical protein